MEPRPFVTHLAECRHKKLRHGLGSAAAILLFLFLAMPCMAFPSLCDLDGNCVPPKRNLPDFGTDANPPTPPGGGPTIFSLANQEPYRNSDMGPLGVVLSTGEFQIHAVDMEIPGRGFPFRLERTYRSKRDGELSVLGHNWQLGYDERLTPGIYSAGGVSHPAIQWRMGNGWTDVWVDWEQGQGYRAFVGFFGRIRKLSGSLGYQIRSADGTVKTFGRSAIDAGGDTVWVLTRIEDRNGNALTLQVSTDGRIQTATDTLGRRITFTHDAAGRLTRVTDFAGRSVIYGYDARGDLVTARSPVVIGTPNSNDFPGGKTTRYRYLGEDGCAEEPLMHNLKSITDAKGQTVLANSYFSLSDPLCGASGLPVDAIVGQRVGEGATASGLSYTYTPQPPGQSSGANVVSSQTIVVDRNGNVQVHHFNAQGNPLSIEYRTNRSVRSLGGGDESDYVVTNTYVDNGSGDQPMLVSRRTESGGLNIDAAGSLVSYSSGMTEEIVYYDAQGLLVNPDPFQKGNVLRVIRTPGSRGAPAGQGEIVTTYAYEPLFNQPLTMTDARGHVSRYTYDYQEGSYAQLTGGAAPASVDPGWWPASEVSAFMALPGSANLGDLNGDGYHRGGNPIKFSEGVATDFAGAPATPGPADEIAATTAYNDFGLPTIQRDAEYNETLLRYFAESNPDGDGTTTPAPPDGRALSPVTGSGGGGYLKEKVLDAPPSMPLPAGVPPNPREQGQNPAVASVLTTLAYDPVGNLKTATDGRGVRTDYSVNSLNQIVQIVRAAASTLPGAPALSYMEQFRYDANNNLVQSRTEQRDDVAQAIPSAGSRRWVTKDIAYDGLDRKISETITTQDSPALSLATLFAYDAGGNLRKTISPEGGAILRFYDERDLLYREVLRKSASPDPADMTYSLDVDSVTQYDYDGAGHVIQVTDPEGHVARNGYDGYGRKVVGFDPAFQKSTFSYDAGGNVVTKVSYGALGGPTPSPAGPPGMSYPELSRQNLYYDELGRLRRTDTKFFRYAGALLVPLRTDSNAGMSASASPDPLPAARDGWVTSLVRYDRLGRIICTVDDNGHGIDTRYDGMGRKIKVLMNVAFPFTTDPNNPLSNRNAVDTLYDANGNVTQILETEYGADRTGPSPRLLPPQQHQATFKYDAMNRQIEGRWVGRVGATAMNLTTTSLYDSRGNRIQVTDPAGGRTKSFYDGCNRLVRTESGYLWNGTAESIPAAMINVANPDGKITTSYAYDRNGRLTSIRDDNGRMTSFGYDSLNRQTRVTYPDATYRETTYDRDSLAIHWEHAGLSGYSLGASTRYDGLHRMTEVTAVTTGAPQFIGTKRQAFEYDGSGRMTLAVDDSDPSDGFVDSEVALAYNSIGKVTSEAQTWRDVIGGQLQSGTNIVTSAHDGVGFRTSVTHPNGRMVSFLPDELSRAERIVDTYTGTTRYDYLGPSRLLNRIYPNGTQLTMLSGPTDSVGAGYDDARRVVDFATKLVSTGSDLSRFTYGYDAASNRAFERREHEGSESNRMGETYGYDTAYRLVLREEGNLSASGALQGAAATTQEFTLDGLGNWSSHRKNAVSFTQTVNALNQYSVFNGPAGQRTLQYDFTGNLTSESLAPASRQYGFDFLNRLVTFLDTGGNLTTYRYDALGRRISKKLNGWNIHTRYVYDGDRLIEERDASNVVVSSYLYGLTPEEVLSRRCWSNGAPSDLFYHTNALGSVAAVTTDMGIVVERYKYDAYGQVTFLNASNTPLTSSAVTNSILFTGRYYDTESSLYYYRSRTYHPYLGRFLQRDPLGEAASLNLYNYVFNNPVNAVDPNGLETGLTALQEASATEWMAEMQLSGGGLNWSGTRDLHQEFMPLQGADLKGQYEAGIAAMDRMHWQKRDAERQAGKNEALKQQISDSYNESIKVLKQKGMSAPVGVAVVVYGLGQTTGDPNGDTDLDTRADKLRGSGYIVIEVRSDTLAQAGNPSEPSASGIAILTDKVTAIVGNNGSMAIEITGFSRGGGGAIQLTNALTDSGIAGSRISADLIDPYMGANSYTIKDSSVSVTVERSMGLHGSNIGINVGASLMGLSYRTVMQQTGPRGGGLREVGPTSFNLPHTWMDSCVSAGGALAGC